MRQSVLNLWLATFLTFFVPVLSCHQRYYYYYKEYQNCNEGSEPGLIEHTETECDELGQKFVALNSLPEMESIFGRDITWDAEAIRNLGSENPNCLAIPCRVVAWRYREWQTNMENRALPAQDGWEFQYAYYGKKVDC